jgi:uncharacterized RDD family membrane protein YckC
MSRERLPEPADEGLGGHQTQHARIARAWPRIAAAIADVAFLTLLGFIVGLLIGDRIAPVGTPARLLGLLIAIPYLAVFGSRLGGGQTFGKTLLKLQVVDSAGRSISLARSTVRAALITTPWLFNGLHFRTSRGGALFAFWIAWVLVYGLSAASIALFLFNRRARQALHDVVTGSYVVEADDLSLPVSARTPRAMAVIATLWIIIVACVLAGVGRSTHPLAPDPLGEHLATLPHLSSFEVDTGPVYPRLFSSFSTFTPFGSATWQLGSGQKQMGLRVTFWYHGPDAGVAEAEHEVASAVLWHYPELAAFSELQITCVRGWDLGIARWTASEIETHSVDEWRLAD